jgi:hypothetical protein
MPSSRARGFGAAAVDAAEAHSMMTAKQLVICERFMPLPQGESLKIAESG